MSGFNYLMSIESENPEKSKFDLSDMLMIDDWIQENESPFMFSSCLTNDTDHIQHLEFADSGSSNKPPREQSRGEIVPKKQKKKSVKERVAFKTKSEVDVLDDGFKWRKYGKKMVKSTPNPRNYYRCSREGCPVKKRVERDGEDFKYVITTYEGIHNHNS